MEWCYPLENKPDIANVWPWPDVKLLNKKPVATLLEHINSFPQSLNIAPLLAYYDTTNWLIKRLHCLKKCRVLGSENIFTTLINWDLDLITCSWKISKYSKYETFINTLRLNYQLCYLLARISISFFTNQTKCEFEKHGFSLLRVDCPLLEFDMNIR